MINVGIIGYGKMGKIRHDVISKLPYANVVSIYEPSKININIEQTQNVEQIINNQNLDAVYICTPNYSNNEKRYTPRKL